MQAYSNLKETFLRILSNSNDKERKLRQGNRKEASIHATNLYTNEQDPDIV